MTCSEYCAGKDDCKVASMEVFKWGHFGSIIFHFLIAIFVAYFGFKLSQSSYNEDTIFIFNKQSGISIVLTGRILMWIGVVFIIITLLSLWPIFNKSYDTYCID